MLQVYKGGLDNLAQATMNALRSELTLSTGSHLRLWTLLATALLLLACGADGIGRASESGGRPLEPVIAKILDAWNHADARAIAAQYESTGDFVSPDGMHAKGKEEIEAFYSGAFTRGYAGSHATAAVSHVRNLSDEIALVDGSWTIEPTPASKIRKPEAGLFFAVLHRRNGRWWIAALREQSSATTLRELTNEAGGGPQHRALRDIP